jgi:hypothetical protein
MAGRAGRFVFGIREVAMADTLTSQRNFLRFVAASPLFAGTSALA